MSSEKMKNSFTNCPPCLLAKMAKVARLVARPRKCYINRLERFNEAADPRGSAVELANHRAVHEYRRKISSQRKGLFRPY